MCSALYTGIKPGGCEVVATNLNWEAGPVNWAEIKRGNAQLMLTAGDRTDDDGGDSAAIRDGVTLYFRTDRSVVWPTGLRLG